MRRTPKLQLVGRAYSEMSPLNPDSLTDSPTTSSAGQDRRGDQSGYGSIFPFGLLRGSFGRGGNASQVGSASICYVPMPNGDCLSDTAPYVCRSRLLNR